MASVSLYSVRLSANTAKWIDFLLEVESLGDTRNNVLQSPYFHYKFDAAFGKLLWALVSVDDSGDVEVVDKGAAAEVSAHLLVVFRFRK